MKISKIYFHHVRIPLRLTFAQANQNTKQSDSVVLHLRTHEGVEGYGESCPRTYVSGETVTQVRQTLEHWTMELEAMTFVQLEDIRKWVLGQLDQGKGPAAVCAIELALLDAWSKTYEEDLRGAMGQIRPFSELQYSGVVPYGNWQKIAPLASHFQMESWKFKAYDDLQLNQQRIADMRQSLGQTVQLRMDANGGWSLALARQQIAAALELGLSSFEQPVLLEEDAITLRQEFGEKAQLMADEALVTCADAERLIARKAYNHFSLKLSKNGGLFNSLRIYKLARANGIACQLSAHFGETSILTAAGALFASLVPELSALEGAMGTYLLREDIVEQALMIDRKGHFPQGKRSYQGWPIAVNEFRLNQYSTRTEFWSGGKAMIVRKKL